MIAKVSTCLQKPEEETDRGVTALLQPEQLPYSPPAANTRDHTRPWEMLPESRNSSKLKSRAWTLPAMPAASEGEGQPSHPAALPFPFYRPIAKGRSTLAAPHRCFLRLCMTPSWLANPHLCESYRTLHQELSRLYCALNPEGAGGCKDGQCTPSSNTVHWTQQGEESH